ncbi:MAG: M48 family metallopeptidase, partial [Acidimicrobiales bacterium]
MDFQTRQDEARQNTARLIALLVLGIVAIVGVVSVLMTALLYYGSGELQPLNAIVVAAPLTTIGVVGASLVKSSQIRTGGGSYVAASMGGRPIDFNTLDVAEKQLGNIVEEIAIASGMPVPAVYVLDNEPAINAFAAGWTADTAAIGVTRGALVHLNRRELQGVIAHEFSHIANGDTRVKTRIIGWVFGIAIITIVGRILLQQLWWAPRRRNRDDNNMAMVMLAGAIGLMVIGALGTFFARLIQAAVSRQREYLADASAVQYTRDPSGIGEALMKIGGMGNDQKIRAAHATEAGHLFFSSALGSTLASHPPLKDRITRLIPSWDGQFATPEPIEQPSDAPASETGSASSHGRFGSALPGQVAIPGMPNLGLPVDP